MKHREIMFRCCLKGNTSQMHSDKVHELRCRARNSGLKAVELLSKVPKVPLIDRFCSVVKLAVFTGTSRKKSSRTILYV